MLVDDIVQLLQRAGGCERTVRLGLSPRAPEIRRGLDSGRVVRVARGLLALPGAPDAVVSARAAGAALTCVSALDAYGLPLLSRPTATHLALASHQCAPREGNLAARAVLHWGVHAPRPVQVGPPLVAVVDALWHAMRCLPPAEAVAAIDAAVHRRLTTVEELSALRPRAGVVRFDRLLARVDGRAESLSESFARLALRAAGLRVEPQAAVPGVGRVDLLVEDHVVVELDGFAYHGDRTAFRDDRRRDRTLQLLGYAVLRFPFEEAAYRVDQLTHEVRALVRARRGAKRPGR